MASQELILNPKPVPQILATKLREHGQKGRRRPLKLRKPRRQRLPLGAERQLRARYLKALQEAISLARERLLPRLPEIERRALITVDAHRIDVETWADTVSRIVDEMRSVYEPIAAGLGGSAGAAAQEVDAFNRAAIGGQMRGVLGVDVFVAEPQLAAMLAASTKENVGLIKSVPATFFDEVEATVLRQFRSGQRAASIAPEIARRFGVSESRAAFIARDQVSKLNGDLTRMRQAEMGVPGYIWRTSLDERVRPRHAQLEGTKQSWDDPPIVDQRTGRRAHPGGDFNCRCTAEPDIEGLLAESQPSISSASVA